MVDDGLSRIKQKQATVPDVKNLIVNPPPNTELDKIKKQLNGIQTDIDDCKNTLTNQEIILTRCQAVADEFQLNFEATKQMYAKATKDLEQLNEDLAKLDIKSVDFKTNEQAKNMMIRVTEKQKDKRFNDWKEQGKKIIERYNAVQLTAKQIGVQTTQIHIADVKNEIDLMIVEEIL